jgi:hypothetical protein
MIKSWFDQLFESYSYPKIIDSTQLTGGDINQVFLLNTAQGKYCIKVSEKTSDEHNFFCEKKSLNYISDRSGVNVPELYLQGSFLNKAFLLMTYIQPDNGNESQGYSGYLAEQLVRLHSEESELCGLEFDTFIGPFRQDNSKEENWTNFYITKRLEPQFKIAFDEGLVSGKHLKKIESLYTELNSIFPKEKHSLLHGDLWSGNVIRSSDYRSFFIDPAIYFGHREMDLGMMKLFGGFDPNVYKVYNDQMPLEKGWQERVSFTQLYPILVHINLFGTSYLGSMESVLKPF